MDWGIKTEMVRLGNEADSEDATEKFYGFVSSHIASFDGQAWCMFAELVSLDTIKHTDFWRSVYSRLKNIVIADIDGGLRSKMRLAIMQSICDDLFIETE